MILRKTPGADAYGIDFPSGATIVLVLAALYLLTRRLRPGCSTARAGF